MRPSVRAMISDSYGPAKRNNALTIFYVAIPVGAGLGTIIGGASFAAKWGWRHAFIWAARRVALALVLLPFPNSNAARPRARLKKRQKRPLSRHRASLFHPGICARGVLGYTAYTFALGASGIGADVPASRPRVAVDQAAEFSAWCSWSRDSWAR